jgi:CRISPR-associated protein Cmr6
MKKGTARPTGAAGGRGNAPRKVCPLPIDVGPIVTSSPESVSNFGLLFQKMIYYVQEPLKQKQGGYHQSWKMEGKTKSDAWRKQVLQGAGRIYKDDEMKRALDALHGRLELIARRFGPCLKSFSMSVDWRLVIGLGGSSPLDTGITLHHLYGFPYLPASGVKGITRSYWLAQVADRLGVYPFLPDEIKERREERTRTPWQILEDLLSAEKDEKAKEHFVELKSDKVLKEARISKMKFEDLDTVVPDFKPSLFRRVFGSQSRRGEVTFLDALPEALVDSNNKPIVELDIINTHYQKYYTGSPPQAPADYHSPIPVTFLAVAAGASFKFRLVAKDPGLLEVAGDRLKGAAKNHGLGAKTMAGYGVMN